MDAKLRDDFVPSKFYDKISFVKVRRQKQKHPETKLIIRVLR